MMHEEVLRVPPHSVDSEQAVIGGLMIDPQALPKIADWLVEEDFYRNDHRLIFRAITELSRRSQPCDAVTMGEWFEENKLADLVGGSSYVVQLANSTPSAANIVAYAEIVREKSILRQLIDVGTTITSNAFTPSGRASSDIVAIASQALTGFAATRRAGLVPAKASLKALAAAQTERYAQGPGLLGLPTPWMDLNRITRGLRNGSLYILGARPSMGKSVFCGNLAYFTALRGKRVAIFSAEMTAQEYAARAVAAHGCIPFEWVEHPMDCEESEVYWQHNTSIITQLLAAPVLIDDTPAVKIEQLQARARREHMRKPLELIVVDHLHDMGIDPKAEARFEYGRAVQGCKTLAKEFNCPVVLAAQLNRNSATRADKRPTMADLRESGEIEQKADVILFLHREDYYWTGTEPVPENIKGVVELIPAKGRNIKTGETIYLKNRFDEMRLDDGEAPKVSQARARRSQFDAREPACAL
jgi:replicative DNA helicase